MVKRIIVRKLRSAATHEDNRGRFYLICLKKKKTVHKVKGNLKITIERVLKIQINSNLPNVLCVQCRILISKSNNSTNLNDVMSTIPLPSYELFQGPSVKSR